LLIIGGGIGYRGPFMGELGEELLKNSVNLEIEVGGLVDVVADVHSIPFPSDYFNGVICQTVLEHTVNSEQAVAEIHRVLKPGGIVYVEVPFLQPVHMTSDFRRYTLMGLETLFRDFEKIKSGVNGGIGSAFTMVGVNFFATLLSFNVGFLYRLWRLFFRFVFAPFKFFDLLFSRFNTAPISSSENYFLGRKKSGLL
jgi:SAM-dependent methyltransferase